MEKELERMTMVIGKLREQFFIHDFEIVNNMLICRYTNETFFPDEVVLENAFKFESNLLPGTETASLNAITTKSSTQGILLNGFNMYTEAEEFLKKVPVRKIYDNEV